MNPYYNTFGNYGYTNPYLNQVQNTSVQPQIIKPVGGQQSGLPISEVRFVTESQADGYIPPIGATSMLIDVANSTFWLKSSDTLGMPSSEKYKFEKIVNEPKKLEEAKKDICTDDFVKKDEVGLFVKKDELGSFVTKEDIKVLTDKIDKLQKQIKINQILSEDKQTQMKLD